MIHHPNEKPCNITFSAKLAILVLNCAMRPNEKCHQENVKCIEILKALTCYYFKQNLNDRMQYFIISCIFDIFQEYNFKKWNKKKV